MRDPVTENNTPQVKLCQKCGAEYPKEYSRLTCQVDDGLLLLTESDRLIGSVIGQRYRIKELIGMGGWSGVYLAEDSDLERRVAIKILHTYLNKDADNLKRFSREAQLASGLSHQNIITVFDCGFLGRGQPYIVMEYLAGQMLSEAIARDGQLSLRRSLNILIQMADGLAYAHRKGIIHRDLKPSNVFLLPDDFVKVLDFGLAKHNGVESLTMTGETFGTPDYMSPEQCRGEKLDGRADIYCLGLLMHEMLTGVQMFKSESVFDAMRRHVSEEGQDLTEVRPDLYFPSAVQAVIRKACSKEVEERFQDCAEFKEALLTISQGSSRATTMVAPSIPAEAAVAQGRGKIVAGGIVAASVAAACGFVLFNSMKVVPANNVPSATIAVPSTVKITPGAVTKVNLTPATHSSKPTMLQHLAELNSRTKLYEVPAKSARFFSAPVVTTSGGGLICRYPAGCDDSFVFSTIMKQPKQIIGFVFNQSPITDKALGAIVKAYPKTTSLVATTTAIDSAGLSTLSKLPLVKLNLGWSEIGNNGLSSLKKCTALQFLGLQYTRVSDAGLEALVALPIKTLILSGDRITDQGARTIASIPTLTDLSLSSSWIGDGACSSLASSRTLKGLELSDTAVLDEGLNELAESKSVTELGLARTKITNKGISALARKCKTLEVLDLSSTRVTPDVVNSLNQFPNLRVVKLVGMQFAADELARISPKINVITEGRKPLSAIKVNKYASDL